MRIAGICRAYLTESADSCDSVHANSFPWAFRQSGKEPPVVNTIVATLLVLLLPFALVLLWESLVAWWEDWHTRLDAAAIQAHQEQVELRERLRRYS
jgi:hypothetical protein